ncbi:MAG: hypothetical protein ABJV04_05910 [Aliiglaciecola sp.]|uniref:tetratricopeptide repeat protein n=1 Tax=Aliiglaciecola sp. TaxID=1872441 RepID=UPI003296C789
MNKQSLLLISTFVAGLLMTGCASQPSPTKVYAPTKHLDEVLFKYAKVAPPPPKCMLEQQQAKVCSIKSVAGPNTNSACRIQRAALEDCKKSTQSEQIFEPELALNLNCHDSSKPISDCYGLASDLNALNVQYPNNKRIMMATALVEFEVGNTANSQQMLDNLLSKRGAFPAAAVLRSRIAMEEGNLTLARSVVSKQLSITPDNPYLYEMQASYYYIEGKYTEALQSIKIAERLMPPNWRISYHRGIIYEAQEQWYKACREYTQVLEDDPSNRTIYAKILLLGEHLDCYVKPSAKLFNPS